MQGPRVENNAAVIAFLSHDITCAPHISACAEQKEHLMSDPYQPSPGLDALFDLSFTRFLTVSVIKVIYLLGILMLCIIWLMVVIAGFSQGFLPGIGAIIVASIIWVIQLLFLRVWLELIVVIFRIGENTSAMARSMGASPPTGGFPVMPVAPHAPPAPGT
jgi:hypothetical protein